MKNRIILGCLCACALKLSAAEVETIPQEKSLKIAHQLVQAWAELDQTQLKINADESKPHALKAGKVAAMVIPDKSFSADALKKPARKPVKTPAVSRSTSSAATKLPF